MNLPFSLPVQEFIRASERLSEFAANHKGPDRQPDRCTGYFKRSRLQRL